MRGLGDNSLAQTVYRAHGERGYTKLKNEFLQDHRISDETRGLVARLLSRPTDWHFTVKEIIASGPSGRDKVYRMIKEAEQYGYIVPDTPRRENGTYSAHSYLVTDDPQVLIQRAAEEILRIQSSTSWNAGSGANGCKTPLPEKPEMAKTPLPEKPLPGKPEMAGFGSFDPLPEKPLPAEPDPAQPLPANPDTYKEKRSTKERSDKEIPQAWLAGPSALDSVLSPDAVKVERDPAYPNDFEEWWQTYPRKVGKGGCAKVWSKMTKGQRQRAIAGLRIQLGNLIKQSKDPRGNFCPYPETWLRQGRYDDTPTVARTGSTSAAPQRPNPIPDRDLDCPEHIWQARLRGYIERGTATQSEAMERGLRDD